MREDEINEAVQMLDLLLEFFADGAHWTRGGYNDGHGGRCLIGALDHLRREHHISSDAAVGFLHEAMPRRTFGLVYFNDRRCRCFAELRSVIIRARGLALGQVARERAAAVVEHWLLATLDEERTARLAVDDHHRTSGSCLRPPGKYVQPTPWVEHRIGVKDPQATTQAWELMTKEVDLCGR